MMLIVMNGTVECPACGLQLEQIGEQDRRVKIVKHPPSKLCNISSKTLRVDRFNGNAEVQLDS